jgi:GGDEF domain-containing protein
MFWREGKMERVMSNGEPELRVLPDLSVLRQRLSFRVQRLEAGIGYVLGGLTVWACVFLNPPGAMPWLLAVFAACTGAWARAYQARVPSAMFMRAVLLQLGGALLLLAPGLGGPVGPALLWPLGVAIGYGLLLPTLWSVPLVLLGFAGFVWSAVVAQPPAGWREVCAAAGGLVLLPALAIRMGRSLRASDQKAERERVDASTQLYNETGFFVNGGELFDECRRAGRPFTLILLNAADLRDAAELLGRKSANQLFEQAVKGIAAATPPGGIAARIDAVEFALAMPGLTPEKAEALLHQRLGRPPQVKVVLGGAAAAILLDCVTAQAPAELHTLEELYDRLHQQLRKRAGAPLTQPGGGHGSSTLQGLLLQDPPVPMSSRPTLPMPLPRRVSKRPVKKDRSRPAPLQAR